MECKNGSSVMCHGWYDMHAVDVGKAGNAIVHGNLTDTSVQVMHPAPVG
jgi:hypothetical protein